MGDNDNFLVVISIEKIEMILNTLSDLNIIIVSQKCNTNCEELYCVVIIIETHVLVNVSAFCGDPQESTIGHLKKFRSPCMYFVCLWWFGT